MAKSEVAKSNTQHKVTHVITELLIVDEHEVTLGSSLREDLGADSIDVVELMMCLEEAFEIEIDDAEAEKIKTVEDIYKLLDKRGVKCETQKSGQP